MGYAQTGADASYATSRLLLRPDDPPTPFKGPLGAVKRGAWSKPLSLKDVKRIKNATKTTVNDVLVSAMAGALRRYMLDAGETPVDFRATVPVNMRTPQEMGQLGNKFGLVFLSLPVSIDDPHDRLAEVHVRMEELKRSSEAGVILAALNVVGLTTRQVQDVVVSILARKATAVLTNVPGPPIPLFLAGREIDDLMFWVPQAGRLGIGISILSYAGKVYVGVATDVKLIPDPDKVIEGFYQELDLLSDALPEKPKRKPTRARQESPLQRDDLSQIFGLTSEAARLLNRQGIVNYKQLSKANVQNLRRLLDDAGPPSSNLDPANWPAQARYLSNIQQTAAPQND
jgi:WS/DGAT/MGAT family acyltransferase